MSKYLHLIKLGKYLRYSWLVCLIIHCRSHILITFCSLLNLFCICFSCRMFLSSLSFYIIIISISRYFNLWSQLIWSCTSFQYFLLQFILSKCSRTKGGLSRYYVFRWLFSNESYFLLLSSVWSFLNWWYYNLIFLFWWGFFRNWLFYFIIFS